MRNGPVQGCSSASNMSGGARTNPRATAETLPNEDLMPVRRTGSRSNRHLSNLRRRVPPATLKVRRTESPNDPANSYARLNNSTVPWKKMELHKIRTAVYPRWDFPAVLNRSLKTLTFRGCKFTWTSMMKIASKFRSLKELILINCKMDLTSPVRWYRHRDSIDSEALDCDMNEPKRDLVLKMKMESYEMAQFCLQRFHVHSKDSPFTLTRVKLVLPAPQCSEEEENEKDRLVPEINALDELENLFVSFTGDELAEVVGHMEHLKASGSRITQFQFQNIFKDNQLGFMKLFEEIR